MRKIRLVSIVITLALLNACSGAGIITKGDNPNVVYIVGEACTINATDDVGVEEFTTLAGWCTEQHRLHQQ